ncbi:MAG TPA: glycosyltransferase family 9 protein, partial [Bacteroidota bacterium]|nr:glycosyltransferase family 9 protein [Bacteroidota bacterium]
SPALQQYPVFETTGSHPLEQLTSVISGARAVITMDTSIVHFASACRTPVLAFYNEPLIYREWGPYQTPHCMLLTLAGKPVSEIPIEAIISKLDELDALADGRTQIARKEVS